ncbi:transcriptional regulator [Pseudoroseomonas cervicalis]
MRKTGISCEQLGLIHGYSRAAVGICLIRQWPAVEAIIAAHLNVRPQDLWPSRYDNFGAPLRLHGDERNANGRAKARHSQKQAVA